MQFQEEGDSDLVLDICYKCDNDKKIKYIYIDTGLEYQATKEHINYLCNRYNINIETYKPQYSTTIVCKTYGEPFLSKYVSEMIQRLQNHNFKWENEDFNILYNKYPNCKVALQWWCNCNKSSMFNIERNKFLKEFIINSPPNFKISNKCCKYAKKDIMKKVIRQLNGDLEITGIRRAEGGIRTTAYKNCFDNNDNYDKYRPIFWYKNEDKQCYEKFYNIQHSACYSKYRLNRTGCVGCPFGKNFEFEINVVNQYEPKVYKAINNIFKNSYQYTREYKLFYNKRKENL